MYVRSLVERERKRRVLHRACHFERVGGSLNNSLLLRQDEHPNWQRVCCFKADISSVISADGNELYSTSKK